MHERRATIRISFPRRAQYCPSDHLLPQEGRLANLSADGSGLFVREPLPPGQQVTVQFPLPGLPRGQRVAATGVVRWSHASPTGRWHPVGLAWLPLEETARRRLAAYFDRQIGRAGAARPRRHGARLLMWTALVMLGALGAAVAAARLRSLGIENRALAHTVQQRDQVIAQLEQRGRVLEDTLTLANAHLTQTMGAVAALDQQTRYLERRMAQLTQDVSSAQASSAQVRSERDTLMQRVLDLEQERVILKGRFSSIPDLRRAMQEALALRQRQQRIARRLHHLAARRAERGLPILEGNRGYLMRNGRPAAGGSTVWIRVHDPEIPFSKQTDSSD